MRRNGIFLAAFLLAAAGVVWAVRERLGHAYLEDDMLWFIPLLARMSATLSPWQMLAQLNGGEISLIDGGYFALMVSLFGFQFQVFTWVSVFLHFLNAVVLFFLLKDRLRLSEGGAAAGTLIYLAFYGHFHAYTFLMAFHHLLVVLFFLLVLYFYLLTDEHVTQGRPFWGPYVTTLLICLPASIQRFSILILPVMVLGHLLYTARDKKQVIFKLSLWTPLFIIFGAYMGVGNNGDVLNRFLEPFPMFQTGGGTSLLFKAAGVSGIVLLLSLLLRALIGFYLRRRSLEGLQRFIFCGIGLTVFLPSLLALCLCLFVRPLDSALGSGFLLERWQRMENPLQGWGLWAAWALATGMLVCGLRHVKAKCPHLIIFFIWYAALNVFFAGDKEQITSRYLVYLSPVFAVLLVILFGEIFPRLFPPLWRRWYGGILIAFLVFMLGQNLLAVKLRSIATLLTDYRWSYDYMKAANLIRRDIERRSGSGGPAGICVDGVRPIPYLDNWRQGFLKDFPPQTLDPFKQILYSARGGRLIAVDSADACPPGAVPYTLTDVTVTTDGKSVEPFYIHFSEGLRSLRQSAAPQAREALGRAVREKPFLFQLLDVPAEFRKWEVADILRKNTASVLYGIYGSTYDPDGKMQYIDTMIRRETYDYGLALVLSAYLGNARAGETADDLLKEAALYVTRRGLEEYLEERGVSFPEIEDFRAFLLGRASRFLREYQEPSWEDIENYRGFRIYSYGQYYFAQPSQKGELTLAAYKSSLCPSCAAARTKRELRRMIAPQILPQALPDDKETRMVSRQGQYVIFQAGDAFYVLAQTDMSGARNPEAVLGRAMFRCTTLAEARASIRLAESFPETAASGFRRILNQPASVPGASLAYRLSWLGLTIGRLDIQTVPAVYEGRSVIEEKAGLRPPEWIRLVSGGRVGLEAGAVLEPASWLPYEYTQTDVYSRRKGKTPRRIVYHHDQLFMERKGREEDILADTRDYVSVFSWLAAQDYSRRRWIKTTVNINRAVYLLVGKAYPLTDPQRREDIWVSLRIQPLMPAGAAGSIFAAEVYLLKNGGIYVPVSLSMGAGMRLLQFTLAQ